MLIALPVLSQSWSQTRQKQSERLTNTTDAVHMRDYLPNALHLLI